jgi:hypothetical protein
MASEEKMVGPFVVQCRCCNTVLCDNSVYHSSLESEAIHVFDGIKNITLEQVTTTTNAASSPLSSVTSPLTPTTTTTTTPIPTPTPTTTIESIHAFLGNGARLSPIVCTTCSTVHKNNNQDRNDEEHTTKNCTLGVVVHTVSADPNTLNYNIQNLVGRYTLFESSIISTAIGLHVYPNLSTHLGNQSSSSSSTSNSMVEYTNPASQVALQPVASPYTLRAEHAALKAEVLAMKKIILQLSEHLYHEEEDEENLEEEEEEEEEKEEGDTSEDEEEDHNTNNTIGKKRKALVTPKEKKTNNNGGNVASISKKNSVKKRKTQ